MREGKVWVSWGSKPQACAPLCHWASLTKHKIKNEIIEDFKMVAVEHETSFVGPSEHSTCVTELAYAPQPALSVCKSFTS